MPRNTREWAKRKLSESQNNINWSGNHIEQVVNVYKPQHPEIAEKLENVQSLLVVADTALTEIAKLI